MSPTNALDLPEIVQHVGTYLTRFNLVQCLTVCKAWHCTFLPLVWKEVTVGHRSFLHNRKGPHAEVLERHRHLVSALGIKNDVRSTFAFKYPNLKTLGFALFSHILALSSGNELSYLDGLLQLIARNPLVERLNLFGFDECTTTELWAAVADLSLLKELELERSLVPDAQVDDFWRACSHLRCLRLIDINIEGKGGLDRVEFPQLRELRMELVGGLDAMGQLDLMSRCPQLEGLVWEVWKDWDRFKASKVWETFAQRAASGTWRNLRQLTLNLDMHNMELSQVIGALNQASKFELALQGIGPLAFRSLQLHTNSLRELRFPTSKQLSGSMLRDIFCCFPELEILKCGSIFAKDVVEGGPWVCQSLRDLCVLFLFREGEQDLQPLIFQRLSKLVKLESFSNGSETIEKASDFQALDFRMQSGLGALASLQKLKCLNVYNTRQWMGIEEAEWILAHLRNLQLLRGLMNPDQGINSRMKKLLFGHGIKTVGLVP
ncbi:hypothetical protein EDD21DRAFT_376686 [Dissophora ornata]|nr:hypothetical protein BGZ58_010791 [Dissophora ornata]KAI8600609.1 hypothetical protein EDD21DRAFT_376686 [Dissophora ornata]